MTDHSTEKSCGQRRNSRTISPDELPGHATDLFADGYRLGLVAGHDDTDRLRAVYLFLAGAPDRRVELHVPLDRNRPHVPSLAAASFPAGRFEREMRDLFGILPENHPLPRRLVRHFHWPQGWFPMLADAGDPPEFGEPDGAYPFRTVEGPGVYEIPVGPVHAGMIEPGHFRFSVVGETILNLKARLWFVHKGLEKLFTGLTPEQGTELAERVSGDTTIGHALAFSQAVEDARNHVITPDAHRIRAILLELERLYNHVTDLGALCNDVGHGILNNHALRIRETLLRLNDQVTGDRLLRGAIGPGRTRIHQLPDTGVLHRIGTGVDELASLALNHTVVRDRFTGTATLTLEQATDLGVLGPVARASGRTIDARHDHPFLPGTFIHTPHAHTDGDVLSRFCIRAEEIRAALQLIVTTISHLDTPPTQTGSTSATPTAPGASGVGIVEGWRGTIVHRIELAGDGTLSRVKIVDPSFLNWPALPVAMTNTIVPDFPLANKSFNLSYAGNDL
ncbi:NADH-quinone oxidoreductase subunit C [Sciscionella sediminilitoris]|uniref:hydrogenase large subunit n=1 Tax=Sciscionella sediminilitoris TaxID=1445613 RepID=UPI0006901C31|nr:NADH-quinone oxidoreductase subunit C [Sciscionella sp. SE31]